MVCTLLNETTGLLSGQAYLAALNFDRKIHGINRYNLRICPHDDIMAPHSTKLLALISFSSGITLMLRLSCYSIVQPSVRRHKLSPHRQDIMMQTHSRPSTSCDNLCIIVRATVVQHKIRQTICNLAQWFSNTQLVQ